MSNNESREYQLVKTIDSYDLVLREATIPRPRSNEVLVKIHAVSVQYRDLMVRRGSYLPVRKEGLIPCSDAAGEIIDVGSDVTGWTKGERVSANFELDFVAGDLTAEIRETALGGQLDGVLTEYKVFPVHSLVRIPQHLSYEEASTLPCAALTAYNALMGPVRVKAGDHVLVLGTGGVSIFALQFASASGASVIATSSSDAKLESAKRLGAKHLINYTKTPNWDEKVLEITNGRGVDHVIEVGGPGTIYKSLRSVRFHGWVHVIGALASSSEEQGNIALSCISKAVSIRGTHIGSRQQFEDMNRLIAGTQLRPVVDKVFPFEHARDAYDHLESQKHVGKVVIKVASN